VRCQRDDDAVAVRRVITAAFGDRGEVANLAAALRARPDRQCSLVAVADERIIGHTHLSVSWVDAPTRLVEVLTLSPLAVDPSSQGRGVGSALVRRAQEEAGQLGAPVLFLEGDPRYYGRFGWQGATRLGFVRPSVRIPDAGFQAFLLETYDPATMSGPLVYNDTFWSHDMVGLRD